MTTNIKTSLINDDDIRKFEINSIGFRKDYSINGCIYNFKHCMCLFLLLVLVLLPIPLYCLEVYIVTSSFSNTYKYLYIWVGFLVTLSLYSIPSAILIIETKKLWPSVLLFLLITISHILLTLKIMIL